MGQRKRLTLFIAAIQVTVLLCGCGGNQGSPERVARSFLQAVVADDCDKAEGYLSPSYRELLPGLRTIELLCGPDAQSQVTKARIDKVLIGDTQLPTMKRVIISGRFVIGESENLSRDHWECLVEKLDDEWYVIFEW